MVTKLSIVGWKQINWVRIEKTVKLYRSRIFLASKSGDLPRLRYLQNRVLKSRSVLLWSIRRITLVNQGKKTPGLDRLTYTTNDKRWTLYKSISRKGIYAFKPLPVRRIYIPKANGKLRPLGIPVLIDRVIQFITTIALEPEWEAKFEHGSYGFRPARSCHDAMIRIYKTLNSKSRTWVLEGDIKGCFDNISHDVLINRIQDFPASSLIRQWLEAGYMEENVYFPTSVGTPQGGAISPLLANIALHGMENALGIRYHKDGYVRSECEYMLVRYADDFVVMTRSFESANRAKEILTLYLLKMGLTLSPEKTHITDVRKGFDFLGWTFRLFPDKRRKSLEVTLVRPSLKSINNLKTKLKDIWRSLVGKPIGAKIRNLNSVINGWANYHKYVDSNSTFRSLDHFNFLQAVRFIRRQHPSKSWKWMVNRYFKTVNRDNWVFYDQTFGYTLKKFRSHKIINFLPVKYGKLPDDPESFQYFADRKRDKLFQKFSSCKSMLKMARSQGCLCPVCGESLASDDDVDPSLHVHHLLQRSKGGKDSYTNLMVLHDSCHRLAHSNKYSRSDMILRLTDFITNAVIAKEDLSKVKWGVSSYYSVDAISKGSSPAIDSTEIITFDTSV